MLEQLRKVMIEAFNEYAKKKPMHRESEWEYYCKCREDYLQYDCAERGIKYVALKSGSLLFSGH